MDLIRARASSLLAAFTSSAGILHQSHRPMLHRSIPMGSHSQLRKHVYQLAEYTPIYIIYPDSGYVYLHGPVPLMSIAIQNTDGMTNAIAE